MSEPLVWELDNWIAEKFMGWKPLDSGDLQVISWEMKDGKIMTWEPTSFGSFRPSTDPAAFALVKREIERRGWSWKCERNSARKIPNFLFEIFNKEYYRIGYGQSPKSEEHAGCLAVKAAIEAIT